MCTRHVILFSAIDERIIIFFKNFRKLKSKNAKICYAPPEKPVYYFKNKQQLENKNKNSFINKKGMNKRTKDY